MPNSDNWVVMPCFNESKHLEKTITDVLKYSKNLVVVDDGSTDNSYEIAKKNKVYVLRHIVNLGKGAALKTGVEFAISKKAKKIVFIDSDGQHEAKELPKFFKLLDEYDIVFGSRRQNKNMPLIFRFGNWGLNLFISLLYGIKIRDTQSGYRGIKAEIYQKIKWNSTDYSVESEIIANTGKNKLKYKEIEIKTIYLDKYKGTTVLDGLKIGLKMILYKFQR